MKTFITISSLFIFLFSAKSQSKLDTSQYAIFQFDTNIPLIFSKSYRTATLTPDEIDKAEQVMFKCISNYNVQQQKYLTKAKKSYTDIDQEQFFIDLSKYKRQYLTDINPKGEKETWVNCFRYWNNTALNYWRKKIVRVADGGNNFFNVIINLAKDKYYNFSANGIG